MGQFKNLNLNKIQKYIITRKLINSQPYISSNHNQHRDLHTRQQITNNYSIYDLRLNTNPNQLIKNLVT